MSADEKSPINARGLQDYFERHILPQLQPLEKQRKRLLALFVVGLIVAVAGVVLLFIGLLTQSRNVWINVMPTVCLIAGSLGATWVYQRVHGPFKKVLVGGVCRFLGFEYTDRYFLFPVRRFQNAGIISHRGRAGEQTDLITGTHAGVRFELCKAEVLVDRPAPLRRDEYAAFSGILVRYHFDQPFTARTAVVPDLTRLGNLMAGAFQSGDRVTLEESAFEHDFEVYSTDQVEARYLLSPRVMQSFAELEDKLALKHSLSAAFDGDELLVALSRQSAFFEGGGIFHKLTDPARAERIVQDLQPIFRVIDTLPFGDAARHAHSA